MWDKFMTHLCLVSAVVFAGTILVVVLVAGVVVAVGMVVVVVVVLVLLEFLMFCVFAFLWGCPPKRVCLPKVLKVCRYPLLF